MLAAAITPFNLATESCWLDFTANNQQLSEINLQNTAEFTHYVFDEIRAAGKKAGIGGYMEHRAIYHRSNHFDGAEEARVIHLGVDIWAAANTPVFAPFDAVVHSFADNDNFGDYGPTIILEHADYQGNNLPRYSLYGHLSRSSLDGLFVGKNIKAGEKIGEIGPYPENGDWPPHLHFQLINDMLGKAGDFPGVCSISEQEFYQKITPSPYPVLGVVPLR